MPKVGEAIEFINPDLDVTVLGELPQELLAMVLWELTHIKPCMKVHGFPCGVVRGFVLAL